jgi:hypothetical protein
MYKIDSALIEKCRNLRREGFTVREINRAIKLSVGTVYNYIRDIPISPKLKEKIILKQIKNTQRLVEFNIKIRKGKCIPGRLVPKPKGWTKKLISLVAHFMFDGEIQTHSCIYHNRNKALINQIDSLMKKVFNLRSYNWLNRETGVHRISYHYVELADYVRKRAQELKKYIKTAILTEKKIFLQAFFDDEGSVHFDKKLVRGFQYNLETLQLIQNLLKDFDIQSKIDEKYKEIVISRKPNLIKFHNKINFSKGIYINPARKNSIWKKKLEKREILNRVINSYIR